MNYEYVHDGKWKVYHNSFIPILRAEGSYNKGRVDGRWLVYRVDGSLSKEYVFDNGLIKLKVDIDKAGNRTTLVSLSNTRVFFEYNHSWMMLVAFFLIGLRSFWNIVTFRKINKEKPHSRYSD